MIQMKQTVSDRIKLNVTEGFKWIKLYWKEWTWIKLNYTDSVLIKIGIQNETEAFYTNWIEQDEIESN